MMQIIHCDQCGGETIALESVSVDVALKKHEWCKTCYHNNVKTTSYFFCSLNCFNRFIERVAKGEKSFTFTE